MRFTKVSTKSLAFSAVSIGSIALVTFGIARAVGVSLTGNDSPPVQGQSALSRPPDRVTVCVDYVEGGAPGEPGLVAETVEALAKDEVEAALAAVQTHPYWVVSGFTGPSVVDTGCPSPPYPLVAGEIKLTQPTTIPSVSQPSYYRTFVFVVPSSEVIDQLLGGTDVRVTIQENLCEGPGGAPPCWEVTQGIYITATELTDGSVSMPRLLEQALGFASRDSGY